MNENAMSKKNLTRAQRRALAVWLDYRTAADVAQAIGVNPSTIHRWKRDPDFIAALRELQSATLSDATAQLVGQQSASIDTLAELRDDNETPPSVRRGASRDLLELSQKFLELEDLDVRIGALEARLS